MWASQLSDLVDQASITYSFCKYEGSHLYFFIIIILNGC